ncbi:MAG: hypothetical protein DMF82_11875 [Acidobacteria bacterium]|nr:MAG: hypothetical protein DMF82_11875 [Acidobacteriota bacterium]
MRAAAGLVAMLLLPGFLVVRAPWPAVPFLSLFFWIASWWWLPSVGRARFLAGALLAFALGSLLRLVRLRPARASWPVLVAVAAALLRAGAAFVPITGAGTRLDTTAAQLMVWHDGMPASYAPLREAGSFGAHPHGLDAVAADLSLLSRLSVSRAAVLAVAAAGGLSVLGLYALLARRLTAGAASLVTAAVAVTASLVEAVSGGGDPAWSLGLGFVLAAAGPLVSGRTRSGAVAAGAFIGTGLMVAPAVVAAGAAAGFVSAALAWRQTSGLARDAFLGRLALAAVAAIATGAPYVVRVVAALAHS